MTGVTSQAEKHAWQFAYLVLQQRLQQLLFFTYSLTALRPWLRSLRTSCTFQYAFRTGPIWTKTLVKDSPSQLAHFVYNTT